jgi:hypothetical protein
MEAIYVGVAAILVFGLLLSLLLSHVVRESVRASDRNRELLDLLMEIKRAELDVPDLKEPAEPLFVRPLPPELERYIAGLEDEQAQIDQREYFQHKLLSNPELEPDDLLTEALRY